MRILILILVTASLYSCSQSDKVPKGILPQDVMISIYEDIRVLEGAKFVLKTDTSSKIDSDGIYYSIFKNHGTTKGMFDSSHNYYIEKPFILSNIYEKVEENLHERKARVDAKLEGGKKNK